MKKGKPARATPAETLRRDTTVSVTTYGISRAIYPAGSPVLSKKGEAHGTGPIEPKRNSDLIPATVTVAIRCPLRLEFSLGVFFGHVPQPRFCSLSILPRLPFLGGSLFKHDSDSEGPLAAY